VTIPKEIRWLLAIIVMVGSGLLTFTILTGGYMLYTNTSIQEIQGVLSEINNPSFLKFFTAVQHLSLFIVPAFAFALVMSKQPFSYLKLKGSNAKIFLIASVLIMMALPFINLLAEFNAMLIDTLLGEDNVYKASLQQYERIANLLIKGNSVSDILISGLIIALLPAIGEELIFRSLFMRLFSQFTNIHASIIISALIFGFVHMEFYGLISRIVMGIFFGYLFVWSKTILVPILVHFINNFSIVLATNYFDTEYMQTVSETDSEMQVLLYGIISGIVVAYAISRLNTKYKVVNIFK